MRSQCLCWRTVNSRGASGGFRFQKQTTFDMIRDLSRTFDTSLTASAYRAMGLTTFRAAIVWSTAGVIRWFKASEEFEAFVAVHDRVPEGTYAYDCFRGVIGA